MSRPTLSVVLPNYNHAHFLPEALEGILSQRDQLTEVIVGDDCSTDNSVEVIERFASRYPIVRLVRNERNMGVNRTVSRLIEMSSGDYVCSSAADDRLWPGFFERSLRLLTAHPGAGFCSTISTVVDADSGRELYCLPFDLVSQREAYISPAQGLAWLQHHESWIMSNTCVYLRQALLDAGGFRQELHAFADGFVQLVLALRHGACFIPTPLATWRLGRSGYAVTSVSSLNVSIGMWSSAAKCMRTDFADLFPAAWVDHWERQRLWHARFSASSRLQHDVLNALKGSGAQTLLDRVCFGLIAASMPVQLGAVMLFRLAQGDSTPAAVVSRALRVAFERARHRTKDNRYQTGLVDKPSEHV